MKTLLCTILVALSIARHDTSARDVTKCAALGQPASAADVRSLFQKMRALIGNSVLNGSAAAVV